MTPALSVAADALPSELRDSFLALVEEYNTSAKRHLPRRKTAVHYGILADLVLNGWRKAAEPHESFRAHIVDPDAL